MGLDMCLMRFPRYKGYTPEEIAALDDLFDLQTKKESFTFEEWTGKDSSILPTGADRDYLKRFYKTRYYPWDTGHECPYKSIREEVAYWRKANHIHKWLVDRLQDGIDDCEYHREATEEDLEDLLDICDTILDDAVLVTGKVINGYHLNGDGTEEPILENGRIIKNPEICEKLLPCTSGFFFGSTEYDQWYIEDVRYTQQAIERILRETDFETQMIYYISSW